MNEEKGAFFRDLCNNVKCEHIVSMEGGQRAGERNKEGGMARYFLSLTKDKNLYSGCSESP